MDIQASLKSIPHCPGIYMFRDQKQNVLYVGKARDLAKRVRSYFQKQADIDWKGQQLTHLARSVETIETLSEFDALLLESKLIRRHMPKFNVAAKDDKSPIYIVLTISDELPRMLFARKTSLAKHAMHATDKVFGPFQSARVARTVMRDLRRIIPFCVQKQRDGRPCFYTHLGLCNPCPSVIAKITDPKKRALLRREYRKNIIRLQNLLNGKSSLVLRQMELEMRNAARRNEFEKAAALRNHIQALYGLLEHHYDPSMYLDYPGTTDMYDNELRYLMQAMQIPFPERIECIDISNLGGRQATGAVVVLTRGRPDKKWYRRFRIRTVVGSNDVSMIREVIRRRFRHAEWPQPDLLLVDGGKPQVRAATEEATKENRRIPIAGLAKRREEIIMLKGGKFLTFRLPLNSPALHVLERIRDEAHRFAISYHRLLRAISFGTIST